MPPRWAIGFWDRQWTGRWHSWLGLGLLVALLAGVVIAARKPAWTAVGLAVILLPYLLLFFHFENRLIRRLVERDHPALCRTCGYDLRCSPDRCPECGGITHGGPTSSKGDSY